MKKVGWNITGVLVAAQLTIPQAFAENFSCSFGQGACLDYGDTVCSSQGKCVSDNAVCFEAYTCGYDGFVCKSEYDNLVAEFEDLVVKGRRLLADYNELVDKHNDLVEDYERLQSCLTLASSIEDAQVCAL